MSTEMKPAVVAELESIMAANCLRQHLDAVMRSHPDWNREQVLEYMQNYGILVKTPTGFLVRMRPSRGSAS